jgi:hypothetical protein
MDMFILIFVIKENGIFHLDNVVDLIDHNSAQTEQQCDCAV